MENAQLVSLGNTLMLVGLGLLALIGVGIILAFFVSFVRDFVRNIARKDWGGAAASGIGIIVVLAGFCLVGGSALSIAGQMR